MPGLNYHDTAGQDIQAMQGLGSQLRGIAMALPRLQMERERLEQMRALHNANKILMEAHTKQAMASTSHLQQETQLAQSRTEETRQKTVDDQDKQKQAGIIGDSFQNINNVGLSPQQNPMTYQAAMAPVFGSAAHLQALHDPSKIGLAIAALQRLGQVQGDPVGTASMAMNRPIPANNAVGTGEYGLLSAPRGGTVGDGLGNVLLRGQQIPQRPMVLSPQQTGYDLNNGGTPIATNNTPKQFAPGQQQKFGSVLNSAFQNMPHDVKRQIGTNILQQAGVMPGGPTTDGVVPHPTLRPPGFETTTAKGTFTWTGNGWIPKQQDQSIPSGTNDAPVGYAPER